LRLRNLGAAPRCNPLLALAPNANSQQADECNGDQRDDQLIERVQRHRSISNLKSEISNPKSKCESRGVW
jgi:hypothetical protein